jgi:hypothetical protein
MISESLSHIAHVETFHQEHPGEKYLEVCDPTKLATKALLNKVN